MGMFDFMNNGDFGGETSGGGGISPSGVAGIDFGTDVAPSLGDPGSGGSFLSQLGAFAGIITSGVTNIMRSTTPNPVFIPRTTNLPASSLQRLTGGTQGTSLLLWVLIGLAVAIGIKFLRK